MKNETNAAREARAVERIATFTRCDPGLLDIAEKAGLESMKQRFESAALMASQAATIATLLLAGIAGSIAYALKVLDSPPPPEAWAAVAFCLWWCGLAVVTVQCCMRIRGVPMIYNAPVNVMLEGRTPLQIRIGELALLQQRIDDLSALNEERWLWLNRVRLAIACTPVPVVIAGGFAVCYL